MKENDFFMDSPAVQKALVSLLEGQRKRIVFKAETAYNTASPRRRGKMIVMWVRILWQI